MLSYQIKVSLLSSASYTYSHQHLTMFLSFWYSSTIIKKSIYGDCIKLCLISQRLYIRWNTFCLLTFHAKDILIVSSLFSCCKHEEIITVMHRHGKSMDLYLVHGKSFLRKWQTEDQAMLSSSIILKCHIISTHTNTEPQGLSFLTPSCISCHND